jgi:DUF4097 and DUF4098 domain-containing protein YvlB
MTDPTPNPHPASLEVHLARGSLRVTTADVPEITVEVVGGPKAEVRISRSSDGRQVVVEPARTGFGIGRHPRVDLLATVPTGSELRATTASASVTAAGVLGSVEVTTASGAVRLDEVREGAELSSASGSVQAAAVGGRLSFRTASGSLDVERTGASCSAKTASGSLTVGLAGGDVSATSVSGGIVVREAHQGTLDLGTTSGGIKVGVRRGTLTWLDVSSTSGRVRSDLTDDSGDADGGPLLTIRASSVSGGIHLSSTGTPAIAL